MLVFQNHPNRACANLGRKPVCSVTFFHRLHPYLLWSLRQTGGGSCCRNQFQILEPLFVRAGAVQDIIDFPVAAPKSTAYCSASLKDLAHHRQACLNP
jgi:hypothetical protein